MHIIHAKKLMLSRSKHLSLVVLFIALATASIGTIWSAYLKEFGLAESTIGLISSAIVILNLIYLIIAPRLLQKTKQTKILLVSLALLVIFYIAIGTVNTLSFLLFAILFIAGLDILKFSSFNILFKENTQDKELNKEEGFMHALINVSWLLGPLAAGYIMLKQDTHSVFFLSALYLIIGIFLFKGSNAKNPHNKKKKQKMHTFQNIKSFLKKENLHKSYIMAAGINVWWPLIYIYVPLFILNNGLNESSIGVFIAAVVIPLVILETKIGKLSEKLGFRFFFSVGFLGLSIIAISLFFIHNIIIQLILLVIASIFAACIEAIQDTYFFKSVKKEHDEEKYFPLFATSLYVGAFIGRSFVAAVLIFLQNRYAYLTIGILMLYFFYVAMKIDKKDK